MNSYAHLTLGLILIQCFVCKVRCIACILRRIIQGHICNAVFLAGARFRRTRKPLQNLNRSTRFKFIIVPTGFLVDYLCNRTSTVWVAIGRTCWVLFTFIPAGTVWNLRWIFTLLIISVKHHSFRTTKLVRFLK